MRYLLLINVPSGTGEYQYNGLTPEDWQAHLAVPEAPDNLFAPTCHPRLVTVPYPSGQQGVQGRSAPV